MAWTDLEEQELLATAGRWRAEGIAYERLPPGDYMRVEPALNPELRAVYYSARPSPGPQSPAAAGLDGGRSRRGGRLDAVARRGGFDVQHGRVTAVRTSAGDLPCGTVVMAAGAWSGQLLEPIGVHAPTPPLKGQIVLLRGERPLLGRIVEHGKNYLVPRDDGRVLVGATEENVGFDTRPTARRCPRLARSGPAALPGVESGRSRSDLGRPAARKLSTPSLISAGHPSSKT